MHGFVLPWATMGTDAHIRFCSRCGDLEELSPRRVCASCGMGVLLAAERGGEPPSPGSAFLICTPDMRVSAVSEAAEMFLGREAEVLGEPLMTLVNGDEIARVTACGPPSATLVTLQKPLHHLRKGLTAVRTQ